MLPIHTHCRLSSVDLEIYLGKLLATQSMTLKTLTLGRQRSVLLTLSIFQVTNITELVVFLWGAQPQSSEQRLLGLGYFGGSG